MQVIPTLLHHTAPTLLKLSSVSMALQSLILVTSHMGVASLRACARQRAGSRQGGGRQQQADEKRARCSGFALVCNAVHAEAAVVCSTFAAHTCVHPKCVSVSSIAANDTSSR